MVGVTHVGDLGDGFADHLAHVACLHDITARSLRDVGCAVTRFEYVLDRELNV